MKNQKFLVFSDCDHTTNSSVSKLGISVIDFLESSFDLPDLQVFFDSPTDLAKDLHSYLDKVSIDTILEMVWVTGESNYHPNSIQMSVYGILRRLSQWPFVRITLITKSNSRPKFLNDWVKIFNIQVINNANEINTKKIMWRGELISYSGKQNSLIDLYSEKDSTLGTEIEIEKEKEQDNEEEKEKEKENISTFNTIKRLLTKKIEENEGSENQKSDLLALSGFQTIYLNKYSAFPKTFFTNERYCFHLQKNNFLNVDMIYIVKPIISQFKRLLELDSWEKKINKREVIKIEKFMKKIDCLLFSVFYDKMEKKWVYQKIILSPKWLFTINSALYQLINSTFNQKSILLSNDNLFDNDLINLLKFQKSKELEELISQEYLNLRKRNLSNQERKEEEDDDDDDDENKKINISPELKILKKRKLNKIKKDKEKESPLIQLINSFDSDGFPKYQSFENENENLNTLKINSNTKLTKFNKNTKMKSWMFQMANSISTHDNNADNSHHGIEYQTEVLNSNGNGTRVVNKANWEFNSLISTQTLQKENQEKVKERILKEREIEKKKRIEAEKLRKKQQQENKSQESTSQGNKSQGNKSQENKKKRGRSNQSNQNRTQIKKCVEETLSTKIDPDHPKKTQIHVSLFKVCWCLLEKKYNNFDSEIIDIKIIQDLVGRWAEYVVNEFEDINIDN
ncbi:nulp1-related [Anaeramoeba flamelloides]|uniref:Nulp1-related n=1 Tax=Anaeramoeba flamelloides TaxID=1746091 RepID=A0AAV7YFH8_9EUKA|nr:nulp1-related [Anaeramoeba flamelloides]